MDKIKIPKKIENKTSVKNIEFLSKIKNNINEMEELAKEGNIDLSDIILWENEAANLIKIAARINSQIPKWQWKKTPLSMKLYKWKYEAIKIFIDWVKEKKINWRYIWDVDYVNWRKHASITLKTWKHTKRFHLKLSLPFIPKKIRNKKIEALYLLFFCMGESLLQETIKVSSPRDITALTF